MRGVRPSLIGASLLTSPPSAPLPGSSAHAGSAAALTAQPTCWTLPLRTAAPAMSSSVLLGPLQVEGSRWASGTWNPSLYATWWHICDWDWWRWGTLLQVAGCRWQVAAEVVVVLRNGGGGGGAHPCARGGSRGNVSRGGGGQRWGALSQHPAAAQEHPTPPPALELHQSKQQHAPV